MTQQTKRKTALAAAGVLAAVALAAPTAAPAQQPAAGEYDLALPQSGGPQDPAGATASSSGASGETTAEPTVPAAAEPEEAAGGGGGDSKAGEGGEGGDTTSAAPSNGREAKPLRGAAAVDDPDSGSGSLPLLLGLLAAIALAGIGATVWRRRRAAGSSPSDTLGTPGVEGPGNR